jgi:Dockerin type I domain
VAAPTRVVVSMFSTDAIKDATVLFPDKRYGKPGDDFSIDGWLVNLSKNITGYRTSVDRQGTSTSFTSAVFKDGGDFDTLVHDLSPDASHVFTTAKTMSDVANAFSHDEDIASWKYHATAAGASLLEILPNYLGVPPRLFDTGFHAFSTRAFNCPKLQVDSVNPTESTVYQVNGVNAAVGAISSGTLTVNAKALDVDSGIDRFPVCSVKYNNIEGWVDQDMGSSDAKNGIFTTSFPLRPGATAVQVQIKYQDKAGHVPAPVTNSFTIKPGVRCNVSFPSNGVNLPAIQRTIRLVLGGDGGPADTANPIVVNKTITFTWNANGGNPIFQGNVLLGAGDGVSTSPSNRLKYAYAKDPYHSLGSKVVIGFNAGGEASASFALKGGDFNNDNTVDATDIASYVAQISNINANTPAIGNSALPVAVGNRNCDITGDGKVDNSDLSVLSIYALTSGDNEPGKYGPKLLGATQITVSEAIKLGVSAKVAGQMDANRDGVLTVKEMLAWLRRN